MRYGLAMSGLEQRVRNSEDREVRKPPMIKNPMTVDEIRKLPASVPFPLACRALNIGRTLGYQLAKTGEFPVKVFPVGKDKYKVPRSAILQKLGIRDYDEMQRESAA
jgi:hypothetical protein